MWNWLKNVVNSAKEISSTIKDAISDFIADTTDAIFGFILAIIKDFYLFFKYYIIAVYKFMIGDKEASSEAWKLGLHHAKSLLSDIISGFVGTIIAIGVNLLSMFQKILRVEEFGRTLTDAEIIELKEIFGDSIPYRKVRIIEKVGLFNLSSSLFVVGYKIRNGTTRLNPISGYPYLLAHEMTHVWQYANGGPSYIADSLIVQFVGTSGGKTLNIYQVTNPPEEIAPTGYGFNIEYANGKRWCDFNPEQQAHFIEIASHHGVDFVNPQSSSMILDNNEHLPGLLAALPLIKRGECVGYSYP